MSTRRATIVDAAARLIERRGYERTSVDDVIAASGLSGKSHFYHYFKSKEELGYHVLEHQFDRFAERGLVMLREPMIDPAERLDLFVDTLVALQEQAGSGSASPFGALAAEVAETHEGFRQRLDLVFERWARQLELLFWELRPRLRAGAEPARLARFVIAALEGGMMMARVKRDASVMRGIGADLKQFIDNQLVTDARTATAGE